MAASSTLRLIRSSCWALGLLAASPRAGVLAADANATSCGVPTSLDAVPCPILTVLPFDEYSSARKAPQTFRTLAFGHMAAVLLAVRHFNAKDPAVVPELGDPFYRECRVEIPLYCEAFSSFVAAIRNDDAVVRSRRALANLAGHGGVDVTGDGSDGVCGVVGPYSYKTLPLVSVVAMSYETPLVSYFPTNMMVGRNHRLALTSAITAEANEKAYVLMEYILRHRNRNYVALLYNSVEFSFVADAFQMAVEQLNREDEEAGGGTGGDRFEFRTFPVDPRSAESYEKALGSIQELGWKTVIGAFSILNQWEYVYEMVEARGMSPGARGYVWYSFDATDLDMMTVDGAAWIPKGKDAGLPAARARLLDGAGYFRVLNGFEDDVEDDARCQSGAGEGDDGARRFLCAWRDRTGADVAVLRDVHPVKEWNKGATGRYDPPDDYFQVEDPSPYAALAYDAVIALGMAQCRATYLATDYEPRKRPPGVPDYPYTNQDVRLYNELALNTTFRGASGRVAMHNGQFYTRPASTLTFGVYNVRAVGDARSNETKFEYHLASVRRPGAEGALQERRGLQSDTPAGEARDDGPWTDVAEFYYANGATVAPANYVPPPPPPPPSNAGLYAAIALGSIMGATLVAALVWAVVKRYRAYLRISQEHERRMEETVDEAERALHTLDYPLHLLRGDEFVGEGGLVRHEIVRNQHQLTVIDSLADVDAFIAAGNHVVFFSHQWTSFDAPDPSSKQYASMVAALSDIAEQMGWNPTLRDTFVWVDYSCIPQSNASTQSLAIRSLAAYASSATYFIVCAPDVTHADLNDVCNLETYQKRMWCRAEQVCHSMRNGTNNMYLAITSRDKEGSAGEDGGEGAPTTTCVAVDENFFRESLHVFDGDLTCCRIEHKGTNKCDRLSLVVPILGLYGELYRASLDVTPAGKAGQVLGSATNGADEFLSEIERHMDEIFPPTFRQVTRKKGRRVEEEVILFGDLIERMRARIKSGESSISEEERGTASTSGTFIRHGASGSDFIRHGAPITRHGGSVKVVETAVAGNGVGADKNPAVDDKGGDTEFDNFQKFLKVPSAKEATSAKKSDNE